MNAPTDSKLVKPAAKRRPPNAGKGRVAGVPNKTTAAVKEALNAVYADLQADAAKEGADGDHPHLMTWAKGNPGEFYKLWIKMLPQDVKAEVAVATTAESAAFKALPKATRDKIRTAMAAALAKRDEG